MTTGISRGVPQENNPTYLQRCAEEIARTDEITKQFDHKATAYKVAAYATIGLFIAVAAAASILVGIYFSAFLPVVGISALCLVNPALTLVRKILGLAQVQQLCAKRMRGVAEEYQKLQANPEEAEKNLKELAFHPLDPTLDYKPLLANYNYWNKLWSEKETELQKKLADAKKARLQDRITPYVQAAALRHEIHGAKVSQAAIIAVINNPTFTGMPNELAYLKDFSLPVNAKDNTLSTSVETNEWAQHALFRDFQDEEAEEYLVFKDLPSVAYKEVDEMSPDQLSLIFDLAIRGPTPAEEEASS